MGIYDLDGDLCVNCAMLIACLSIEEEYIYIYVIRILLRTMMMVMIFNESVTFIIVDCRQDEFFSSSVRYESTVVIHI